MVALTDAEAMDLLRYLRHTAKFMPAVSRDRIIQWASEDCEMRADMRRIERNVAESSQAAIRKFEL